MFASVWFEVESGRARGFDGGELVTHGSRTRRRSSPSRDGVLAAEARRNNARGRYGGAHSRRRAKPASVVPRQAASSAGGPAAALALHCGVGRKTGRRGGGGACASRARLARLSLGVRRRSSSGGARACACVRGDVEERCAAAGVCGVSRAPVTTLLSISRFQVQQQQQRRRRHDRNSQSKSRNQT